MTKVIVNVSCAGKGWKLEKSDDPQDIDASLAKELARSGLVTVVKAPAKKVTKKKDK